jgi:hypothetical protein
VRRQSGSTRASARVWCRPCLPPQVLGSALMNTRHTPRRERAVVLLLTVDDAPLPHLFQLGVCLVCQACASSCKSTARCKLTKIGGKGQSVTLGGGANERQAALTRRHYGAAAQWLAPG